MIDIDRLRKLVVYREDGELIHLPRLPEDFSSPRVVAAWNSRWAGQPACQNIDNGYRRGTIDGEMVLLHRAVYAWHTGLWVPLVDHRDTDTLNNRIGNLRDATKSQNNANGTRKNQHGYKGVARQSSGRFKAQIALDGKKRHGGTFDTAEEAAKAYDIMAREQHGEFARLNFPE